MHLYPNHVIKPRVINISIHISVITIIRRFLKPNRITQVESGYVERLRYITALLKAYFPYLQLFACSAFNITNPVKHIVVTRNVIQIQYKNTTEYNLEKPNALLLWPQISCGRIHRELPPPIVKVWILIRIQMRTTVGLAPRKENKMITGTVNEKNFLIQNHRASSFG